MNKTKLFISAVIVIAGFALAACSASTPEPVTFTIDMTEYAFNPDTLEVKVGQEVTINLVNSGVLPHEIMFGRDVMMVDNRPSGYEHDMFEEAGVEPMVMGVEEGEHMEEGMEENEHGHEGFMVLLEKTGDQGTITFTVTEEMVGEWEIGCFELDGVHYDQGMVGKIIVTQ